MSSRTTMAACGPSVDNDMKHNIYQVIERYELERFLKEAVDKRVISEKEKREVEQSRRTGYRRMREELINLILRNERLGRFIDFIDHYAGVVELAMARLRKQVDGCDRDSSSDNPNVDFYFQGASHSYGQQLSQDSSNSVSMSPMEFELVSNT